MNIETLEKQQDIARHIIGFTKAVVRKLVSEENKDALLISSVLAVSFATLERAMDNEYKDPLIAIQKMTQEMEDLGMPFDIKFHEAKKPENNTVH